MASSSLHGVPRDGSPASSILWDAPTPRRPSRLVPILHEPIPSCRPWFAPLGRGRPTGGQGVVGSGLPIRIDDGNVGVSQVPWKPWWSSSVLFDPGRIRLGGFRVALDMAFRALSKYDFCFVGMGFPEDRSLGMEANGVGSKRILESADQAKSPRRILVRSLLKSRNKLREKYCELRAECKRWRNQAAAVERSRSTWAVRVGTRSKCPRGSSRAGQARVPTATTPGAIGATGSGISRVGRAIGRPGRGGKKGVVNRLADCARERIRGPWAGAVDMPPERAMTVDLAWAIDSEPVSQPQILGEAVSPCAPRPSAASKFPYRYQPRGRQRCVRWVATGRFGVLHWRSNW